MAVDIYANENVEDGKRCEALNIAGNKLVTAIAKVNVKADDGEGAIYRLFEVGANLVPVDIRILNTAITGGTDYDLGIFKGSKGEVIDADVLMDGQTLATAAGIEVPLNGLSALDTETVGKRIYELAGHTESDKDCGYEIGLTANAAATAEGTIVVIATFVQG